MLKLGTALLGVWTALNLLVALAVTVMTLRGAPPPALRLVMTEREVASVEPRAIAVINTQATIANPLIIAVCAFVIVLLWRARHERWVLHTLASILVPVQAFGFVSDTFIGSTNLVANCVSTLVLLAGLASLAMGQRAERRVFSSAK